MTIEIDHFEQCDAKGCFNKAEFYNYCIQCYLCHECNYKLTSKLK